MSAFLDWFNVERTAVLVAAAALLGVFYSARQARAAREQAQAARDQAATSKQAADAAQLQARHAEAQVDLARKQTDLLLRQIEQGEVVAAETRRAQREALQPVVVLDISPGVNDPGVFVLTIANTGPSVARDVQIEAPTELLRSDGTKMHEWPVFTKGIKTMPPGHRIQFFFDVSFQRFGGRFPMEYTFVVDCNGPFGPAPRATYVIDFAAFGGAWAAPTTLGSVVKQIEQLSKVTGEVKDAVRMLDPERRAWMRRGFEETDPESEQRRI